MAVLIAEDKSRYDEMNIILYETDASKPLPKWLSFKYFDYTLFYIPSVSLRAKNGR